jgi:hypothetical protein
MPYNMEKEHRSVPESRTGRLRNYLRGGTVGADVREDVRELKTNLGMLGLDLDNAKRRLRRGGGYRWPVREAAPVFAATAVVVYLAGAEEVEAQPGACEHLTPYGYSPVQNGQPGMECFEKTLDGIQGNEVKVAYYPPIPTPEPGILSTPMMPTLPTMEIPQIVIPTLDIPTITIPTPAPLPTFAPLPTVDLFGLFDPSATNVPVSTIPPVDWENSPIGEYGDEIIAGSAVAVALSVLGGALLAILTRPGTSRNSSQGQPESEPGLSNDGRTPRAMRPAHNTPVGQPVGQGRSRDNRSESGGGVQGENRVDQTGSASTRYWTQEEINEHDARVDATIIELERKYGFRPRGTRGSRGGKGR